MACPMECNRPPNKNPVSLLSSRTKHRTTPLSPSASQQSGSPCVRIYLMQPPLTLCVPRARTRLSVSPVPLVFCPRKHHQQTPFYSLSLLRSSRGLYTTLSALGWVLRPDVSPPWTRTIRHPAQRHQETVSPTTSLASSLISTMRQRLRLT